MAIDGITGLHQLCKSQQNAVLDLQQMLVGLAQNRLLCKEAQAIVQICHKSLETDTVEIKLGTIRSRKNRCHITHHLLLVMHTGE